MLKPNKYTNVGLSVIGISAEILFQLSKEPSQKYNRLLRKIMYRLGENAKTNFLPALLFLFSTGKIKYYSKEDAIELLHDEEQK